MSHHGHLLIIRVWLDFLHFLDSEPDIGYAAKVLRLPTNAVRLDRMRALEERRRRRPAWQKTEIPTVEPALARDLCESLGSNMVANQAVALANS